MRVGVDSYSYHRLLGELRPGEAASEARLADGGLAVLDEISDLGIDGVALQTAFLESPDELDVRALRAAAETQQLELVVSWGAPNGIELGSNRRALDEMLAWIDVAADLGSVTMRIVAGGPAWAPRSATWPAAVAPLRRAAARARSKGLVLALENHGDLTASQIRSLLDAVADEALVVCFDTANALRVGDIVTEAAALLAPDVRMLHLKDVESLDNVTNPIAGPRSVPYDSGVIPVIDVLDQIGIDTFRGLVCVEVGQLADDTDERAFVRDSVKWLRDFEGTSRPTSSSPEVQHASD